MWLLVCSSSLHVSLPHNPYLVLLLPYHLHSHKALNSVLITSVMFCLQAVPLHTLHLIAGSRVGARGRHLIHLVYSHACTQHLARLE